MHRFSLIKIVKILFAFILLVKIIIFFLVKMLHPDFIFLGGDSDYYNDYALGLDVEASSVWPIFLKSANDFGFYNRNVISFLLLTMASLLTPFLFAKLLPKINDNISIRQYQLYCWCFILIVAIYPTIFVYSLDIYRDVLMVVLFGFCLHLIKKIISTPILNRVPLFIVFSIVSYLLFLFRPYLGFAVFAAIFLYRFEKIKLKLSWLVLIALTVLTLANSFGILDPLYVYREGGGFDDAGSTLGVTMSGRSFFDFIAMYLYSTILQLFGLYINSLKALLIFIAESLFFMVCVIYTVKNRRYLTPFLRYLIVFSIIYGTIWVLANDNLGTAVRLRIYNYLALFLIAASIYLQKAKSKKQ